MIQDATDLVSLLHTADAYLRTRVALYLDFPTLLDVDQRAQRIARDIVDGLGFPGLLDGGVAPRPAAPTRPTIQVEDFSDLSFGDADEEPVTEQPEPSVTEPPSDDTLDLDLDFGLPDEPTQVDFADEEVTDGDGFEIDLDLDDDDGPSPLEPLPAPIEDEDVSDPVTLGDPDETEDLLREPEPEPEPVLDVIEDDPTPPVELDDIAIEGPGQDALVTIEDTSDPRSDLEGLSRLSDSDLDDEPDTGSDEVIVRTTEPRQPPPVEKEPERDFSPDDEETFIADLADIQKMKAKMASVKPRGTPEVQLPAPEPRAAGARAAAAAGVTAVGGAAGVYGASNVPQIRDRNAPKPRAAAIQIDAAQEAAKKQEQGGGSIFEEEVVLELGASEDYGEEEVEESGEGGLSLDVQEYEEEYEEEEEEEEEVELEELQLEPPVEETIDPAEIQRLMERAEAAIEEGDMDAAIDFYSDVIDLDPENAVAHVRRGRLHLDYGDYSRAMSDFMIAEELAPDDPEPRIAVGDLYFARKDYKYAIECFNGALEMDPNNAMAFCRRGISYYYRKRYAEALADLTQAQRLDDSIPNIRTYISMAKKKARR